MVESRLREAFTSGWAGRTEDLPDDLEERLEAAYRAACEAWPEIALSDVEFVRYLAERLPVSRPGPALTELHISDLYLAYACAAKLPTAISAFDRTHLAGMRDSLKRLEGSSWSADDVLQIVRTSLLVGKEATPPRIREYKGRGPLGAWLKVVAQRTAIDLRRREGAHERTIVRAQSDIVPLSSDPELDYIKDRYRDHLKTAFHDALVTLSARQRILLKMHFIDQLSHDRIGTIYKVHQTTVTRWIEAARGAIYAEVTRLLSERVGAKANEITALFNLVRSQLDLSLTRIFGEPEGGNDNEGA